MCRHSLYMSFRDGMRNGMGDVVEGLMHLAPACSLWLGIGVVFVEARTMARENALQLIVDKPFLYALAAAMGFMVNLLAYVVIQTSSSLTLKVLGTVKNALVVWIGVVFLGDIITGLQVGLFENTLMVTTPLHCLIHLLYETS